MTNKYTSKTDSGLHNNFFQSILTRFFNYIVLITLVVLTASEIQGQAVADFSTNVTSGCSPITITFTNNSTGTDLIYSWSYGDGTTSSTSSTTHTHTYNNGGEYVVRLIVKELLNQDNPDTAYVTLNITKTVSPHFIQPVNTSPCKNEWISLYFNQSSKDSVLWNFGDGNTSKDLLTFPMTYRYASNGTYTLTYTTYNKGCDSTSTTTINVSGPEADFIVGPDSACKGETITFEIDNAVDVLSYEFHTDESAITGTTSPFTHEYATTGNKYVELELSGAAKTCYLQDTIYIFPVKANIDYSTAICAVNPIFFVGASEGANLSYFWDFGDGNTSTERSLYHTYTVENEYIITHSVRNHRGCADTVTDTIYAATPPPIQLVDTAWFICRGDSAELSVTGGDSVFWQPGFNLNDPYSYTPKASPNQTMAFSVSVADRATGCSSAKQFTIYVQQEPNWEAIDESIVISPKESVIIGDTVVIQADSGAYIFEWSPDYQILTCINCAKLGVLPLETTLYTLQMSDTMNCFSNQFEREITVREEYRIGVPEAFTPNGDNTNDVICVNGWGIKSIVEFRVYNRWGKEVFFTDNAGTCWDGFVEGKPAPIDTYAYVVKAEMWSGETIVENGTFTLIR